MNIHILPTQLVTDRQINNNPQKISQVKRGQQENSAMHLSVSESIYRRQSVGS